MDAWWSNEYNDALQKPIQDDFPDFRVWYQVLFGGNVWSHPVGVRWFARREARQGKPAKELSGNSPEALAKAIKGDSRRN